MRLPVIPIYRTSADMTSLAKREELDEQKALHNQDAYTGSPIQPTNKCHPALLTLPGFPGHVNRHSTVLQPIFLLIPRDL